MNAPLTADLQAWAAANAARHDGLDRAAWRAGAAAGLFALDGATAMAHRFHALGRAGADRGLLFAAGAHLFGVLAPFLRHATPAQRARWEAPLRDGTAIGALAVTEPAGGSSFQSLATTFDTTLTGTKTLVTNAPDADLLLVLARQFPDRGPMGLTMLAIPAAGLAIARLDTAGLPGAPMGSIRFDATPVPDDAILGHPGRGLLVFNSAMAWERALILAGFLGAASHDLATAVRLLHPRGVLRHQSLLHRLARTQLALDAAWHLILAAAASLDAGREDMVAAAAAKLAAAEAAVAAAQEVARLLAGPGWRRDGFDPAAALTDCLGILSASGTADAQLDLIGRAVVERALRA